MAVFLSEEQKLGFALAVLEETRPRKFERKVWTKNWLKQRRQLEAGDFRNYLRMDEECFTELLSLVKPILTRKNTVMREAVSCEERWLATLRFLATGRSYEDLKFTTIISPQLLSKIIPETCSAIYSCLKKYIKMPLSAAEWEECADTFERKWDFSHCVGAMDGKHVAINKPPGSGSLYYNYKHFFSIILFAVVNADYEFMYVNVGTNGCVSDASVLNKTSFYKKLVSEELDLPAPSPLPNSEKIAPYVFLGDSAFALTKNIMKPFPLKGITRKRRIYNYRHCRSRRVVENAFGILAARFHALLQALGVDLQAVDIIVLACCALHNFLSKRSRNYISTTSVDREDFNNATVVLGDWRQSQSLVPLAQAGRHRNEEGSEARNIFMEYFDGEGRLDFQHGMISNICH